MKNKLVSIGTQTPFGIVKAVLWIGERYYLMLKGQCSCSLMPATVIESEEILCPK